MRGSRYAAAASHVRRTTSMAHYYGRDTIDDLLNGVRSPPRKHQSPTERYMRSPLSELINDARRAQRRKSCDDILREAREAELQAESARLREEISRLEAEWRNKKSVPQAVPPAPPRQGRGCGSVPEGQGRPRRAQ